MKADKEGKVGDVTSLRSSQGNHTPGPIEPVSADNVILAKAIYGEESPEYALFRLAAERDALTVAVKAALEYVSSEAVGTAQEEIEENERMREILRTALSKVAAKP